MAGSTGRRRSAWSARPAPGSRLSPSRTASACAPSPSRSSASRAWKNRSRARRSGRRRRLIRTSSTKAARKTPQSRPAERLARYRARAAGRWSWVRRVPAAYDGSASSRSTIRVTRKYSLSTRWTCARPLSAARNHSSASPAARAAEELPGLELVRREPEPGPQRRDQLDRLADAQVDTRVRDHRGGRIEQIGAGEPGLVAGDLHDGAGHRVHRRQPALKRQPHTRSLTMPTMLARPPASDHRLAASGPLGCASCPAGRGCAAVEKPPPALARSRARPSRSGPCGRAASRCRAVRPRRCPCSPRRANAAGSTAPLGVPVRADRRGRRGLAYRARRGHHLGDHRPRRRPGPVRPRLQQRHRRSRRGAVPGRPGTGPASR